MHNLSALDEDIWMSTSKGLSINTELAGLAEAMSSIEREVRLAATSHALH